MSDFGLFVSNEDKNVLNARDQDLCFSADLNMFKIKQEVRNGIGETTNFDHGLNYFPFFLSYTRDTNYLANAKRIAHTSNDFVSNWSGQINSDGYMFLCHNPGVA